MSVLEDAMETCKPPAYLLCPVCLDVFSGPRLMPCSHTLCGRCVDGLLGHAPFATLTREGPQVQRTIPCPVCRTDVDKKTAGNLPVNRALEEAVLDWKARAQKERISWFTEHVSRCKEHNKPADLWCVLRNGNVCADCCINSPGTSSQASNDHQPHQPLTNFQSFCEKRCELINDFVQSQPRLTELSEMMRHFSKQQNQVLSHYLEFIHDLSELQAGISNSLELKMGSVLADSQSRFKTMQDKLKELNAKILTRVEGHCTLFHGCMQKDSELSLADLSGSRCQLEEECDDLVRKVQKEMQEQEENLKRGNTVCMRKLERLKDMITEMEFVPRVSGPETASNQAPPRFVTARQLARNPFQSQGEPRTPPPRVHPRPRQQQPHSTRPGLGVQPLPNFSNVVHHPGSPTAAPNGHPGTPPPPVLQRDINNNHIQPSPFQPQPHQTTTSLLRTGGLRLLPNGNVQVTSQQHQARGPGGPRQAGPHVRHPSPQQIRVPQQWQLHRAAGPAGSQYNGRPQAPPPYSSSVSNASNSSLLNHPSYIHALMNHPPPIPGQTLFGPPPVFPSPDQSQMFSLLGTHPALLQFATQNPQQAAQLNSRMGGADHPDQSTIQSWAPSNSVSVLTSQRPNSAPQSQTPGDDRQRQVSDDHAYSRPHHQTSPRRITLTSNSGATITIPSSTGATSTAGDSRPSRRRAITGGSRQGGPPSARARSRSRPRTPPRPPGEERTYSAGTSGARRTNTNNNAANGAVRTSSATSSDDSPTPATSDEAIVSSRGDNEGEIRTLINRYASIDQDNALYPILTNALMSQIYQYDHIAQEEAEAAASSSDTESTSYDSNIASSASSHEFLIDHLTSILVPEVGAAEEIMDSETSSFEFPTEEINVNGIESNETDSNPEDERIGYSLPDYHASDDANQHPPSLELMNALNANQHHPSLELMNALHQEFSQLQQDRFNLLDPPEPSRYSTDTLFAPWDNINTTSMETSEERET